MDVFANPNVDPVLKHLSPDKIVLYGVALDVCNACAINGLLEGRSAPIYMVLDATRAIIPERGLSLVSEWRERGVEVVDTALVIEATR